MNAGIDPNFYLTKHPWKGIPVSIEEFTKEYIEVVTSITRDRTLLYNWFLVYAEQLYLRLLHEQQEDRLHKTKLYKTLYRDKYPTLIEEWLNKGDILIPLWYCFRKLLTLKINTSSYSSPTELARILMKKFLQIWKRYLWIQHWRSLKKKDPLIYIADMDQFKVEETEDFFWLRHYISKLPPYQRYIMTLSLNDYTRGDLTDVTQNLSTWFYYWRTINDYFKTTDFRNNSGF